jgi:hypothetical protein
MRFEVVYRDGVFNFVVQSLDPDNPHHETFEILDVNEAKDVAWDLIEEISVEDEQLFEEFVEEGEDE